MNTVCNFFVVVVVVATALVPNRIRDTEQMWSSFHAHLSSMGIMQKNHNRTKRDKCFWVRNRDHRNDGQGKNIFKFRKQM